MSDSSIYAHRILNGRTFRLVLIQPALDPHQQLECECLPFEIDAAPEYEALSYVWGPPGPLTEILCNGISVGIQAQLANALQKVRLRGSTVRLWADAICINQQDNAEKSHQVPLMGSIYSSAKRVIVWLDHGDSEKIQEALESINYIATNCRQHDQDQDRLNYVARHTAVELPKERFSPTVVSSLEYLFSRPWFSRIWCVQEIYLAQEGLVLWGEQEISWLVLGLGASWIFDQTSKIDRFSSKGDSVASRLNKVDISRADIVRDKAENSLLETLQSFREFEATDPKDKVYGLLNLVSQGPEVEALKVDYDKSVDEVYADTVLIQIRLYSLLSAFAYITHPEDYDGSDEYRSWAPRWDDMAVAKVLGLPEDDCAWNTCGQTIATIMNEQHRGPQQLCLKGMLYDRVLEIEETMDWYNLKDPKRADSEPEISKASPVDADDNPEWDGVHPFLIVFERITRVPFSVGDPTAETLRRCSAFARTITAGNSGDADLYVQSLDSDDKEKYYEASLRAILRLYQLHISGDEGSYHHDVDSYQFQEDAYHTCKQRRMFWTENGSLGLGPQCMEVGDIVVVLYGGSTPYVLRPRGDNFLFMGQSYVDNIMQGELLDSLHAGKVQEQIFCLV